MKTTSLASRVALAMLCSSSFYSITFAASSSTEIAPISVPITQIPTTLATSSDATPKPFVKRIVSKLADIPDEKKNVHIETPLGSAAFTLYNKLAYSSIKTESTLKKLDEFLTSKEAEQTHPDTTKARFSYEAAKMSLENANGSLSLMSGMLEKWMSETSTTTFKKAVGVKKVEFKNQAEQSRVNIKAANEAIKDAVTTYKAAEQDFTTQKASSTPAVPPKDQTIFDLASSSQNKNTPLITLPISEVSKTLKQ